MEIEVGIFEATIEGDKIIIKPKEAECTACELLAKIPLTQRDLNNLPDWPW